MGMKIVIARTPDNWKVRVIDDHGLTTRKFTYRSLVAARRAAVAWSAAYGDCEIVDAQETVKFTEGARAGPYGPRATKGGPRGHLGKFPQGRAPQTLVRAPEDLSRRSGYCKRATIFRLLLLAISTAAVTEMSPTSAALCNAPMPHERFDKYAGPDAPTHSQGLTWPWRTDRHGQG